MKKRLCIAVAACLALAAVFAACENGTQEIEGDVGVKYSSVSAPRNLEVRAASGSPTFVVVSWTAGPGYEERKDRFEVFARVGRTNTAFLLVASITDVSPSAPLLHDYAVTNAVDYSHTAITSDTEKTGDVDEWNVRIKTGVDLAKDLGLASTGIPGSLATNYIYLNKIQFGVRAVPGSGNPNKVPSAIVWTPLFP